MQRLKQTKIRKRGSFNNPRRQSGYILVVSIILLGAMLIATLGFFEQSADSVQMSGYSRDSAEALLLAESAMNMLYGTFVFNKDIDNDAIVDRDETYDLNNPNPLPLPYMYFVSAIVNAEINQAQPSILQLVANGEARSGTARTAVAVSSNVVPSSAGNLLINELFTATTRPVLYTLDNNNRLVSSNNTWATMRNNNQTAAVAWLELTRDTTIANSPVEIYVQSAAQVGRSINYVQRFIGILPNTLGILGGANESSP